MPNPERITEMLLAYRDGDPAAFAALVERVYPELRRVARQQLLSRGRPDPPILDTTGLVHETYLKLIDQDRVSWKDRGHFLAIAACAMRQVIIDHARARLSIKRGAGASHVPLDAHDIGVDTEADLLLAVDAALEQLARTNPRLLRVVECRFYAGYTEQETAEALGVSAKTIERDWSEAKALLRTALSPPEPPDAPSTPDRSP
jgi:RNA polymerase sigma factor (TIGR02999 family)